MNTTVPECPQWTEPFLSELAKHGLLHKAAAHVGTTLGQVKKLMAENIEFETAVEEACEAATDLLEEAARERALNGVVKGVYYKGDLVDTEVQYSDSLMALFLKAKRKSQFGDKTEISGPGGKALTVNIRTFAEPTDNLLPVIEAAVIQPALSQRAEDFV